MIYNQGDSVHNTVNSCFFHRVRQRLGRAVPSVSFIMYRVVLGLNIVVIQIGIALGFRGKQLKPLPQVLRKILIRKLSLKNILVDLVPYLLRPNEANDQMVIHSIDVYTSRDFIFTADISFCFYVCLYSIHNLDRLNFAIHIYMSYHRKRD